MVMVDLEPFMPWKTLGSDSEHIRGRMTPFDTNLWQCKAIVGYKGK